MNRLAGDVLKSYFIFDAEFDSVSFTGLMGSASAMVEKTAVISFLFAVTKEISKDFSIGI